MFAAADGLKPHNLYENVGKMFSVIMLPFLLVIVVATKVEIFKIVAKSIPVSKYRVQDLNCSGCEKCPSRQEHFRHDPSLFIEVVVSEFKYPELDNERDT